VALLYAATIPETTESDEVTISCTYRVLVQRHGHLLYIPADQGHLHERRALRRPRGAPAAQRRGAHAEQLGELIGGVSAAVDEIGLHPDLPFGGSARSRPLVMPSHASTGRSSRESSWTSISGDRSRARGRPPACMNGCTSESTPTRSHVS